MQEGSVSGGAAGGSRGSGSGSRRRVALTAHKDRIAAWVAEGKSDRWIGSALGTTGSSVQSFRSRHDIYRGTRRPDVPSAPRESSTESSDEVQGVYEGVLEQGGDSGHGLWLDPAVADDPVFERGFGGVSDVEVMIEARRIVVRAADGGDRGDSADSANVTDAQVRSIQPSLSGFDASGPAAPASNRESGRLKFFDAARGYGFIVRNVGQEIFCHGSELGAGAPPPPGAEVSYEVSSNSRGLVAVDVRRVG